MTDDFPNDYCAPKAFCAQYPNIFPSEHSLRWELRFRHQNGLIAEGVVMEVRADPNASRGRLLVSPSRYFARLRRNQGRAA